EIIARRICCQSKMATAIKASTRSTARSLRISVVIYPARPDLDRHGAKLSRVAFVGCRLEADTVAMFDALTVQLCDVEK
ncbi:MAG: hypothetical protein WCF29_00910, partial [Pseudolabrys sp.]